MLSWVSLAHSACCTEVWHPALQTRVPGAKWPHLSSKGYVQTHCTQHCDLELQGAQVNPPVRTSLPPRWQPFCHINHINLYLYHIEHINSPAGVRESMFFRPQAPTSHALTGIKLPSRSEPNFSFHGCKGHLAEGPLLESDLGVQVTEQEEIKSSSAQ